MKLTANYDFIKQDQLEKFAKDLIADEVLYFKKGSLILCIKNETINEEEGVSIVNGQRGVIKGVKNGCVNIELNPSGLQVPVSKSIFEKMEVICRMRCS